MRGWAEQESHTKSKQSIIWGSPESHSIIAFHGRKAFRGKKGALWVTIEPKMATVGLGGAQK